jgi:hypothetical protein
MNSLADLSHEEYKQKYNLGLNRFSHKANNKLSTFKYDHLDADALPPAVDWREKGAVAEVKNQAQVSLVVGEFCDVVSFNKVYFLHCWCWCTLMLLVSTLLPPCLPWFLMPTLR